MSHDPAKEDFFAIIPILPGHPPANAISWGGGKIVQEFMDAAGTRKKANALLARADDARAALVEDKEQLLHTRLNVFHEMLDAMQHRMDQLEARLAAEAKADAEAEQREILAQLDQLPDIDDPEGPAIYGPSGELHTLEPTQSPGTTEDENDMGALPASLTRNAGGTSTSRKELAFPTTATPRAPVAAGDDDDDEGPTTLAAITPAGRVGW